MDVIFIEDRKEFDSITRNENLKYVKEHRNTVLLTSSTDIPRNINKDIKLTDSNVGYSVKYISESANVYSVGSVWVELKNIDDKLVKDNIKISLGTSTDYYTNLRVALETKKPKVDLMRDSLNQASKALNDEDGKDSEVYYNYGDYNFCVRLALFDDLFANFANRMDGFDVGALFIGMENEDEYIEEINKLISDISDAENNGDEEKYKDLDSKLESVKTEYRQYIYSKTLEGIREHNTYHLARIANFEEYAGGIKKYCSILETHDYFVKNISWESISLDSFLDSSKEDKFFKYDSRSNGLLVFENRQDLLICKNSIILVGSNGVGKSKFLNYIYKLLSYNIFQDNEYEGEIVCLQGVDVFINEQKKNMKILLDVLDKMKSQTCLCHIDSVADNFIITADNRIKLIDWEYAGMAEPIIDIAMCAIYSYYTKEEADALLESYLKRQPTACEYKKLYAYMALSGYLWALWTVYKSNIGEEFGEYSLKMYRYAKDFFVEAMSD